MYSDKLDSRWKYIQRYRTKLARIGGHHHQGFFGLPDFHPSAINHEGGLRLARAVISSDLGQVELYV